jgi:hypothetical protein
MMWKTLVGIAVLAAIALALLVWIVILLLPPALLAWGIWRFGRGLEEAAEQEEAEQERIRAQGLAAQAVVLRLKRAKGGVERTPSMDLTLKVKRGVVRPYGVRITAAVPDIYLPRVQAGKVVPVFVDPQDMKNLVLDVDALAEVQATPGGGPAQECAYCKRLFSANDIVCPHCNAPVEG